MTQDPPSPEGPEAPSPVDEDRLTCDELLRLVGAEGAGNTGPGWSSPDDAAPSTGLPGPSLEGPGGST